MIRYALACDQSHGFDAWFASSADYDAQSERGLVECPLCGSTRVAKQVMAPAVSGTRSSEDDARRARAAQAMMMEAAHRARDHVEAHFDYVGDTFAREARAIHEGRTEAREIYGEATAAEVRDLKADGVPCAPLPPARPDRSKAN